jgi:hypothetical protein
MKLSALHGEQAERFRSMHSLFYDLPEGKTVLMLSGIVDIDLRSPGWTNEAVDAPPYCLDLALELALPPSFLQGEERFEVEQSLPVVGLGSLAGSTNVSWGVNQFSLASDNPLQHTVVLSVQAEVARSSEVLKSLSFAITLLGRRCC